MKALELTIYPPIKPIPRFTYSGDSYPLWAWEQMKARKLIKSKRFSGAELAAEYWALGRWDGRGQL